MLCLHRVTALIPACDGRGLFICFILTSKKKQVIVIYLNKLETEVD